MVSNTHVVVHQGGIFAESAIIIHIDFENLQFLPFIPLQQILLLHYANQVKQSPVGDQTPPHPCNTPKLTPPPPPNTNLVKELD
jgi:hypothetical protein